MEREGKKATFNKRNELTSFLSQHSRVTVKKEREISRIRFLIVPASWIGCCDNSAFLSVNRTYSFKEINIYICTLLRVIFASRCISHTAGYAEGT